LKVFLEIFLLPSLAAILPWPLCFRVFRRIADRGELYPEVEYLARGAHSVEPITDLPAWRRACRLLRLFSFADLYLSMFRGERWMKRYVDVDGHWPEGAFLAVTFHWGAGMWALRHLRASGKRTAFLSLRFDRGTFHHALLRYWYALLRSRETRRAGGAPVIYTGGSSEQIRQALRQNTCVAALLDVPPRDGRSWLPVELFGRPARLPRGLVRLASEERIPVVSFAMNLDRQTGRLKLRIRPLCSGSERELMDELSREFRALLAEDPPAWHGWADVQLFFEGTRA
jgi:hypothetical protein